MVWNISDPQGDESGKIKHLIVPYTRGVGLDIGCGPWKAYPHFIGVDNCDEWGGLEWRPDVEASADNLFMFASGSLDFVYSSHTLEHVEDTEAYLREWWRVIKPGGHLVLYLPHADHYPRMGEPGSNPDHKHDFTNGDITEVMTRAGRHWTMLEDEVRTNDREYSFFQVYRKDRDGGHKTDLLRCHGKKSCLVIRYGGFGDVLQASSVLPELKEQGYHITFQAAPTGHEVLRENPYIDRFWIQGQDQVPNKDLGDYWRALGNEFDRIINLCESVEGALLAVPGRRDHAMTHAARHATKNVNYIEFIHMLADVPFKHSVEFYPTKQEAEEAERTVSKIGRPVVMWALAGSSVHKTYPWVDYAAQMILQHTDVCLYLVGGPECAILEHAIQQQLVKPLGISYEESHEMSPEDLDAVIAKHFGKNRLIRSAERLNIRQTLSLAQKCAVVVGPETGTLNAVCQDEQVHKVIMLSHSSHENLTKYWTNTHVLEPVVPCYPCHRMHYNTDYCPRDEESGASQCASSIGAILVFNKILRALEQWRSITKPLSEIRTKKVPSATG